MATPGHHCRLAPLELPEQDHPAVHAALMLEQEPQESLAAVAKLRREHQIAVPLLEQIVDHAGVLGLKRVPVDMTGHARRQDGAQHRGRVLGVAK
jgi:hypothetical protein